MENEIKKITPLPKAPVRGSETYEKDVETFLDALPNFAAEINELNWQLNENERPNRKEKLNGVIGGKMLL